MDTTAITNAALTVKSLDNVTKNQGNVKEDVKAVGKYRTVMVVNVNYITVKKASMVFFWGVAFVLQQWNINKIMLV